MVRVEKLNYTHTDSGAALQRIELDIMEWHHAKITVSGSALSVTITSADGIAETLLYIDDISFVGGRIGFYSSGASMSYRNLKIEG